MEIRELNLSEIEAVSGGYTGSSSYYYPYSGDEGYTGPSTTPSTPSTPSTPTPTYPTYTGE